jgi:hypothetical protein
LRHEEADAVFGVGLGGYPVERESATVVGHIRISTEAEECLAALEGGGEGREGRRGGG